MWNTGGFGGPFLAGRVESVGLLEIPLVWGDHVDTIRDVLHLKLE